MRLGESATAFALGLLLAQGALPQNAPVSKSIAGLPCKAVKSDTPAKVTFEDGHGTVIISVRITKSGLVHDLKVVSGPPTLRAAAIKAVKRWKYKRPDFVTGSPSERQTVLFVTLVKDAAPKVEEGIPAGVPGCGPTTAQRVRILQSVMQQRMVKRVEPVYPPGVLAERIEGTVVVNVTIDKGGSVYKAEYVSGPPMLVPAAIEAVKQWKYQPYLIGGEPVEVETTAEIRFTL